MKRISVIAMLLVCFIWLTGCQTNAAPIQKDTGEIIEETDDPHFAITSELQNSGIVASVRIKNNPGFLTMAVGIEYDESAMALTEIKNGADFGTYNFVGPKNMQSGCMASWFSAELPEEIKDGELFTLHFTVLKNTKSGEYPITITCPHDGSALNDDMEPIVIARRTTDYIKIK